jgi:uncharacterized membrane protein
MRHRKAVLFLIFLATFTTVYSSVAFFALSKAPSQAFIGFGIFSSNGSLSNYYQNSGEPNVTIGQTLNWTLQIANHVGRIQMAEIVVRMGNLTTIQPTATGPANAPDIEESIVAVPNNENSTVNFDWKIIAVSHPGRLTYLTLEINGKQVKPPVGAASGQGFRFIFELWTLEEVSGSFQYGYPGDNGRVGNWLMLWFNSAS